MADTYEDGYESGYEEGFRDGRGDGYDEGFEDGREQLENLIKDLSYKRDVLNLDIGDPLAALAEALKIPYTD